MLHRLLVWIELKLTGHWTYCDGCKKFSPPNKNNVCRYC